MKFMLRAELSLQSRESIRRFRQKDGQGQIAAGVF